MPTAQNKISQNFRVEGELSTFKVNRQLTKIQENIRRITDNYLLEPDDLEDGGFLYWDADEGNWAISRDIFVLGTLYIQDGTAAAPGLAFANDTDTGIFRWTANGPAIAANGKKIWWWVSGGSNYAILDNYDDGAGNIERLEIFTTSAGTGGPFYILQNSGGTGTARDLYVGTTDASDLILRTSGLDRWTVDASGHLVPVADDSYAIGTAAKQAAVCYAVPIAAMWKSNSENGSSVPIWDTESVNTDSTKLGTESSDTQIHIEEAGTYRIHVDFGLTLAAGAGTDVDLRRNGSTIDGRCTVDNGDTTGAASKSGSISVIVDAAATDYWEVVRGGETWLTNDVWNRFSIERLN